MYNYLRLFLDSFARPIFLLRPPLVPTAPHPFSYSVMDSQSSLSQLSSPPRVEDGPDLVLLQIEYDLAVDDHIDAMLRFYRLRSDYGPDHPLVLKQDEEVRDCSEALVQLNEQLKLAQQ